MKKFALLLVAVAVVSIPCFSQVEGGLEVSGASPTKSLKLDHFWCYNVASETPQSPVAATLTDQFFTTGVSVSIGSPTDFCNPVQKTITSTTGTVVTPIVNVNDHLTRYHLVGSVSIAPTTLTATNQFGSQQFTVDTADSIMVPTQKLLQNLRFPTRLDHYLCYPVSGTAPSISGTVTLADQFQTQDLTVGKPELFCNPVQKTIAGQKTARIQNPAAHLLCYGVIFGQSTTPRSVPMQNQIEADTFSVTTTTVLCVPSTKTVP